MFYCLIMYCIKAYCVFTPTHHKQFPHCRGTGTLKVNTTYCADVLQIRLYAEQSFSTPSYESRLRCDSPHTPNLVLASCCQCTTSPHVSSNLFESLQHWCCMGLGYASWAASGQALHQIPVIWTQLRTREIQAFRYHAALNCHKNIVQQPEL